MACCTFPTPPNPLAGEFSNSLASPSFVEFFEVPGLRLSLIGIECRYKQGFIN